MKSADDCGVESGFTESAGCHLLSVAFTIVAQYGDGGRGPARVDALLPQLQQVGRELLAQLGSS